MRDGGGTGSAPTISRRRFLQAAGGLTFLSLVPIGNGFFALKSAADQAESDDLPVFTALPYIQPGPSSILVDGQESIVIAWQTLKTPADYVLTYHSDSSGPLTAIVARTTRNGATSEGDDRYNYAATLSGLDLEQKYKYAVSANGTTIAEGYFSTRKRRGTPIRFVAFGDNSYGEVGQRAVAYYAYKAHPDFVMNTGDNVYDSGLDNEYSRYFFPVYNAELAHPTIGGPLLRSVPFYTVIANHDVHGHDANKHPVANFDADRDSLAIFTNMYLPMNGPIPDQPTPIAGADDVLHAFKDCAGDRYPRMANYSFDYGDAHFLCLDSNVYIDPANAALQAWIADDLSKTDALWKFVVFHHPGFNVGQEHFQEQHMRALSPLFEQQGVDIVLHGHEHVYQRTMPLRFAPTDTSNVSAIGESRRLVPGKFTLDTAFDGDKATKPSGIIYIVTGAGGKHLYDPTMDNAPATWTHVEDGNVAYLSQFHSAYHSFTTFDIDGNKLTLRQTDEFGREIDKIAVTKA